MVDSMTGQGRYRFAAFEFDADSLELRKQGRLLRMRPQALKLLRLLVARAGQLVSRDEIQRELWGGETFIDFDQGVNHGIKQLRAAFGDDVESPRYIQTLPRRGYRFVAAVERVVPDTPGIAAPPAVVPTPAVVVPAQTRHRWQSVRVLGAISASVLVLVLLGWRAWPASRARSTTSVSVAVLPFTASGLPADNAFAGSSLADAVSTRLGLAANVHVRPPGVVAAYGRRTDDAQEIGRGLGVDYVVKGTLRRDGNVYRLESELLHVGAAGSPPTAVSVSAEDLLGIEARLVDRLVTDLNAEQRRGGVDPQTQNPVAYEAYLEGRFHLARATAQDTETAVALFDRSVASDDRYALAHAGLARASALMYIRFASQDSAALWKARAEREAATALRLNDRLAEAHEALAAVARFTDFDWEAVIAHSVHALRLNAGLDLPHYYMASALQHVGRLDLVEREVADGLDANPLNLSEAFRLRGVNALWGGKFDLARSYLQRVRELSDRPISDPHLAQAFYYLGQPLVAEAMLTELTGSAQVEQRGDALRASFMAARGDRREALALVQRVQSRPYRDHHVAYSLGAAYAGLGDVPQAMRWLEQAAHSGFLCRPWYEGDPLLGPLRGLPAFQRLLDDVTVRSERVVAAYRANAVE